MGLLDGALGNASKIDPVEVQQEFSQILVPGEVVEHAYQLIRDYFVFTNKRFVLVDKQGMTGRKVEYHSIPYKSITHFSVETAGTFDLDAELNIWISGTPTPIQKQFNSRLNIYEVQSVLAMYVLGNDKTVVQSSQHKDKHSKQARISAERKVASPTPSSYQNETADNSELEFCFHCGESVKSNVKQCPGCGESLE
jgi:hypothetical protein